jgi:maltose alpha-D-glucosyltransferase/alpha-amylase
MIEVRKQNPAFGLGTWEDLGGSNSSVLSFVRAFGDDVVLCVNNLSRFPQPVELPYLLTLAGHGFYWFRLTSPEGVL